jgi:protein phosphatase
MSITLSAFGLTDVGVVRKNNEDSFLIADIDHGITDPQPAEADFRLSGEGAVLLVADGMGGLEAGEVASGMAVNLVATKLLDALRQNPPRNYQDFVKILRRIVQDTNRSILEAGRAQQRASGMGTTLTAAALYENSIYFAQLGDSRAYLLRNGHIIQMTKDQSLVAKLVAAGSITPEQAKSHPRRNVILQALGVQPDIDVVLSVAPVRRGDRLVLCSDGLWGKVDADEIKEFIERFNLVVACESLVRLARDRGGEDNITIVAASFDGEAIPQPDLNDIPKYAGVELKSRWRFWPWKR